MAPPSKKGSKTVEEIREQKRECERRRRARIKENPVEYEKAKEKDRERKNKNHQKKIAELTPRQQRSQRKSWRERQAKRRLKKKLEERVLQNLRDNTPESSADEDNGIYNHPTPPQSPSESLSNRSLRNSASPSILQNNDFLLASTPNSSRQKRQGILAARRKREAANVIIKKQRQAIEKMRAKLQIMKTQLWRSQNRRDPIQPSSVRPKLTKSSVTKMHTIVRDFLSQDDNSKLCPGKRDFIVRRKIRKQKRYLNDTMTNLHLKFIAEKRIKVSLATFCRLRPFWIIPRKISERDTCLCTTHENIQLIFDKLKCLNIIRDTNLSSVVKSVVCDKYSFDCMYRKCQRCCRKTPQINEFEDCETTYRTWKAVKETRIIRGQEKEIRRVVKAEERIMKRDLLLKFLDALEKFMQHIYNDSHQYKSVTLLKDNLADGEILMHIDFAENYCCKYSSEIQSVHFGASRQQVALHTGVYYYRCQESGEVKEQSFCTISDCLNHGAAAIYAHMDRILSEIVAVHAVNTLHIKSDGPSGQYKNRKMFYLFTQEIASKYNILAATWNFSETGHGKGPMDGVGAAVKQIADRFVCQGQDIPDYDTFVDYLKSKTTKIQIFTVSLDSIQAVEKLIPKTIKNVPGCTKLHQITWSKQFPKKISLRKLTCIDCKPGEACNHYDSSGKVIEISSSTEKPVERAVTNEDLCGNDFELNKGNWVVTRFFTKKKTYQYYVGQILDLDDDVTIKFTKKLLCSANNKTKLFTWVVPEDISEVARDDIVLVLPEPTPGRRGELIFNENDLSCYKIQ